MTKEDDRTIEEKLETYREKNPEYKLEDKMQRDMIENDE